MAKKAATSRKAKRSSGRRDTVKAPSTTMYAKRTPRGRFKEVDEKGRSLKVVRSDRARKFAHCLAWSPNSASACSSQKGMSISRYIVEASTPSTSAQALPRIPLKKRARPRGFHSGTAGRASACRELVEQGLGLSQIGRIEALGEPAVDVAESPPRLLTVPVLREQTV
jgi:hypothetical protein